jgi:hypothetical protein
VCVASMRGQYQELRIGNEKPHFKKVHRQTRRRLVLVISFTTTTRPLRWRPNSRLIGNWPGDDSDL